MTMKKFPIYPTSLFFTLGIALSLLVGHQSVMAQVNLSPQGGTQIPDTPGAVPGQLGGGSATPQDPRLLQTAPPRPDLGATDAPRSALTPMQAPKPQAPNQFQRFIQESTGRMLPHFGANLFDNPMAYAADAAAPAPAEYVLGPGDEVRIQVWGSVDFTGNQTLDRNGQIHLPKIGTINLKGVKVKDLEATLRQQVAVVFNKVQVNASLGKLRGITVYVVGHAQLPGTYNLSGLSTLINAVFASGGPSSTGSMRVIELKRGERTVTTLDLYDFIAHGDKSKDVALLPGDVITIAPALGRVALTGATDHAAIYELKPNATVKDILALGGGLPTLSNNHSALLERIDASQVEARRQVQDLPLNSQGMGQILRDGDVITLLPVSPAFANAVTLRGAVAQPRRHAWFNGMRVSDLIPNREALVAADFYKNRNQLVQNSITALRSQGFTAGQIDALERAKQLPQDLSLASETITGNLQIKPNSTDALRGTKDAINWDYAVIQRFNRAELKTDLIPFNLGKAVLQKDPAHNLVLLPDDVVTVMNSADLQLPVQRQTRLVRLEGEVVSPGVYQAMPGETLPALIKRAGGLTPEAYLFGAEFTRESVRKLQQENLDQWIKRLESQTQSANATLAANLSADRVAQAQVLQQQQQQQQQQQVNRLRSLKSKGRVSLELALPKKDAPGQGTATAPSQTLTQLLPPIPLEDGDALVVPSMPSFVAAVGSVNNENAMVYRRGKTVGQLIKSAGLTEDANPKQAFLLRADGSILSRKSGDGWFSDFESTWLYPGDTLVVPAKVDRESNYSFIVRGLRDWTQIFSGLGIGAAAIRTLRN
jgi:protein involved in polysaccharide export with SLBB domain